MQRLAIHSFAGLLAAGVLVVGCATTQGSSDAEMAVNSIDPISGEPVQSGRHDIRWNRMVIGFASQIDANQFAALSDRGKHKAIARTVQNQLDSINDHCPVSGGWLIPGAQAMQWGEYTIAVNNHDVNQWHSLPEAQQAKLIAPDVLRERRVVNTHCPISGERLMADAPTAEYDGEIIGFASQIDKNQWGALPERSHARLIAGVSASH